MLKSMRIEPKPQPPAAASAWMIVSDWVLFGSVETSVFQGFGASNSCPGTVVVLGQAVVVVVLGREVELEVLEEVEVELVVGCEVEVDELVLELLELELVELELVEVELEEVVVVETRVVEVLVVEVDVELVVGCDVDVEELEEVLLLEELVLDDVLVVVTRVDEVLVVDVVVVVVFFLRSVVVLVWATPQAHAMQACPSAQSAAVSHCSPAAGSTRPSPQVERGASNRRRFRARALNVPAIDAHDVSSTFAFRRTLRSVPHAA